MHTPSRIPRHAKQCDSHLPIRSGVRRQTTRCYPYIGEKSALGRYTLWPPPYHRRHFVFLASVDKWAGAVLRLAAARAPLVLKHEKINDDRPVMGQKGRSESMLKQTDSVSLVGSCLMLTTHQQAQQSGKFGNRELWMVGGWWAERGWEAKAGTVGEGGGPVAGNPEDMKDAKSDAAQPLLNLMLVGIGLITASKGSDISGAFLT